MEIEASTSPKSLKEITKTLFESLPQRFQDPRRKKLICLSRLDYPASPEKYHLIALHGTLDTLPEGFEGPYKLEGSLTNLIRSGLSAKYFHDIDFAHKSAENFNAKVLPGIRCTVACPITTKKIVFGALVILSSHCDLEGGEMIKKVFEVFSSSLARLLFDEEAGSINQTVSGFRHDIQPIINNLQDEAGRILELENAPDEAKAIGREVETTANLLASIVEAQCRYRVNMDEYGSPDEFCKAHVKQEIEKIWNLVSKKRELKFAKGFTRKSPEIHLTTFQAVVWNLLRNCFAHSPVRSIIEVKGSVQNGFLNLEFKNMVLSHFDKDRVERLVEKAKYEISIQTASQEKYPPISGLANVSRLLRWAPRLPQKEAKLEFGFEKNHCMFRVSLPTNTE